jgi:hypothetical protein
MQIVSQDRIQSFEYLNQTCDAECMLRLGSEQKKP